MMTRIKTAAEIKSMRTSGQILATVYAQLRQEIAVGMSTKDLANIAQKELKALGGKPSFLGYEGYPDVICISLNEEIVHGIPSPSRYIAEGDIVSCDFGVTYNGMITDSAFSMVAGKPKPGVKELLACTERSLNSGIDVVKNGVSTEEIGAAIEDVLKSGQYGIVRDLVGHGVGHQVHEAPNIPNFRYSGNNTHLKSGMTIAIEPMATLGSGEVFVADDGWAVISRDKSLSAHFEHTVLITDDGAEILTTL